MLGEVERVTLKTLAAMGVSNREAARNVRVTGYAVRNQLRRVREDAVGGHSKQESVRAGFEPAIDANLVTEPHWVWWRLLSPARGGNEACFRGTVGRPGTGCCGCSVSAASRSRISRCEVRCGG